MPNKPRYSRKTTPLHANGSPSADTQTSTAIGQVIEGEVITTTQIPPGATLPIVLTQQTALVSARRRQEIIERTAQYRWKPGQSGNPGGIGAHELEVRRLCRENAPDLVSRGIEILHTTDDERVFFVGMAILLERGFGKPRDVAPEDAAAGAPDISGLSDKDLAQLRKLLEKALPKTST